MTGVKIIAKLALRGGEEDAQKKPRGGTMPPRNHRKSRRTEDSQPMTAGPSASALARRLQRGGVAPVETAREPVPSTFVEEYQADVSSLTEDEGEWAATLPEPTPQDIATATAQAIAVTTPDEGDLDRLWDWLRGDFDRGLKFLGIQPQTSREMRERIDGWTTELLFSIYEDQIQGGPTHIGFVGLGPVPGMSSAMVRLYLSPDVRGRLSMLVPKLLGVAETQYPQFTSFIVMTDDMATARLYRQVGFEVKYLLEWKRPQDRTITVEDEAPASVAQTEDDHA